MNLGSVVTAARGELRDGNHAEFTLLERKCLGEKLDGCVLFSTLEPCLDRNAPKRGCARHIVSARIKEVYVGIIDDNPAVARKGIEYLERHGVVVQMFARELQQTIEAANKEFFEWARRQTEEPAEPPTELSKYEKPVPTTGMGDLSREAMEFYRSRLHFGGAVGSTDFRRLLLRQGILLEVGRQVVPSGFGLILFGKAPGEALPQARLLARAELADGKSSRQEFGEALVLVPGSLETWLNKVLPSTLDRSRMERREQVDLPFEMIREAVVNALIHRDYGITGAKCQLVVTADTIVIKSPGAPIPPITMEQMRSFTAPMISRNPLLHYVFARLGLAEEQGYGLNSLKAQAEKLVLPLPSYTMEGDSLVLTIYRSKAAATSALGKDVIENLSKAERAGWEWLATRETTSSNEYATAMEVPNRTALNHLKRFTSLRLLEKTGSGPTTQYRVIRR